MKERRSEVSEMLHKVYISVIEWMEGGGVDKC